MADSIDTSDAGSSSEPRRRTPLTRRLALAMTPGTPPPPQEGIGSTRRSSIVVELEHLRRASALAPDDGAALFIVRLGKCHDCGPLG
ncbi:hypothetical protein [Nannocystis pusilla]|uniref:Uncharacterized protein n=1 Tax=Nannocystis pusilla TaxID=889268 RepID=A0ABS7TLZ6_9BACT|nr:hypothetical protein [Nannocystis pusilla]MBZ5709239.1 hypothetical protein [Nannocystis pusilla]